MANLRRYFDNAATTPVDPRVLREMLPYLEGDFGNAHSIHSQGLKAQAAVALARERIAELIGAEAPEQITFTSGATEANNWVLRHFTDGYVSPFEHSSVLEPAKRLGMKTLSNTDLRIEPPSESASFISIMAVNNEIGSLWQPIPADKTHSDITQALGKVPFTVEDLDYASFSGHKFYGPKGIGALYSKDDPLPPLLMGGEQENGLRAGTLNVPAIVGMGAAAAIALDEQALDYQRASSMRQAILEQVQGIEHQVNGGAGASPFILSLSFPGVEGEALVIDLDHQGYAISSGAACSSRSTEPSTVLTALGLPREWLRGTVRISFGRFNDEESAAELGKSLRNSVQKLRTMS